MATDPMRARALSILREGRCSVVRSVCDETYAPRQVMALVRSSRPGVGRYTVELHLDRTWSCSCSSVFATGICPHRAAVQLVTVGEIQGLRAPGVNADLQVKTGRDGGPDSHLAGSASGALTEAAS